jgi:hypothetical protein
MSTSGTPSSSRSWIDGPLHRQVSAPNESVRQSSVKCPLAASQRNATSPPPTACATISGRPSPSRSPIAGGDEAITGTSIVSWVAQLCPSTTRSSPYQVPSPTQAPAPPSVPAYETNTSDGWLVVGSLSKLKSATMGVPRTFAYGSPASGIQVHCVAGSKMPNVGTIVQLESACWHGPTP